MAFVTVPITRKEYEQLDAYNEAYRATQAEDIHEKARKLCDLIELRAGIPIPVQLGGPAFLSKIGRYHSLVIIPQS